MNTQAQRPAFEEAVEQTVAAVKAAMAEGAGVPEQLFVIKQALNDITLFDRKEKNRGLVALNTALGTKHEMNHVKAALAVKTVKHKEPSLIPTDELHGSVQAKLPGSDDKEDGKDNKGVDPHVEAIIQEDNANAMAPAPVVKGADDQADVQHQQQEPQPPAAAPEATEQAAVQPNDPAQTEGQDMTRINARTVNQQHLQAPRQAPGQPFTRPGEKTHQPQQATKPTATQEQEEMTAAIEQTALTAIVGRFGYTSVEARAGLYLEFLATKATDFPAVYKDVLDAKGHESRDLAFATAYGASQPVAEAFNVYLAEKHPQLAKEFILDLAQTVKGTKAEDKSWFSLTGSEGNIRSGWMAAGAALAGAALETAKAGEITIGSGVGAAVGVGAAFLAGEHLIDKHVDGQFGRYVAAGSVGLILGATGSALGRMAGGAIETRLQGADVSPAEIVVNQLPASNPVKVSTTDFSKLGLMSF